VLGAVVDDSPNIDELVPDAVVEGAPNPNEVVVGAVVDGAPNIDGLVPDVAVEGVPNKNEVDVVGDGPNENG
jgi:hypothetical protein